MRTDLTALIVGLIASLCALLVLGFSFFDIDFGVLSTAGPFVLIAIAVIALFVAIRGNRL
ncbi:MAG: hypothetical protein LBU38_05595 [Propionibacteriaceae bacterium]|jgi:hypothetical protein|nr:hypothetical protein [Propionibacteriaceae bacterium]